MCGGAGMGKSTASRRLTRPWVSLSDDASLVVPGDDGRFWAHPWPTWSRFFPGGAGGSWETGSAVPLLAVFFLSRRPPEVAGVLSPITGTGLLVRSGEECSWLSLRDKPPGEVRLIRRRRFENAWRLAHAVPAYGLHLTLTDPFWEEMDSVLAGRGVRNPRRE